MILLSYYGWKEWEYDNILSSSSYNASTSYDRLFGVPNANDVPLAYGTGAILLWDIPLGIFAPSLQDTIMLLHHVGMFSVAAVMSGMVSNGRMIGYYYVPFYFGVIETSSVFLSVVDQFHPKRVEWYDWLHCNGEDEKEKSRMKRLLLGCNEVCRMGFAISFIVLRGVYFPYTSFFHCIPDIWRVYYVEKTVPEGVPMWTGYFLILALVLFSCLQSYWGFLVGRQVKKALFGDDDAKKKKKKDKKKV
ncbi:hypothetical protein ACHAWO_006979 [Cyclotella atomus]|uniref:TLC domain-containing protein n=1 Tax=Cyclotella atomus TaxID=382360 RepID=A0ABD3NRJ8_9STRA